MGRDIGSAPRASSRGSWVQTERQAHEAWADLIRRHPNAARLLHLLVANMEPGGGAVVASQGVLAELLGVHRNSVRRAIRTLEDERWIEVVQLGGKGGALGYVVNSKVAWSGRRDGRRYARFTAEVLAAESEQTTPIADRPNLRRIPTLTRGERQLPTGPGEDPPSQPSLEGLEPDLPAIVVDEAGRRWEVDRDTGELQALIEAPDDET